MRHLISTCTITTSHDFYFYHDDMGCTVECFALLVQYRGIFGKKYIINGALLATYLVLILSCYQTSQFLFSVPGNDGMRIRYEYDIISFYSRNEHGNQSDDEFPVCISDCDSTQSSQLLSNALPGYEITTILYRL